MNNYSLAYIKKEDETLKIGLPVVLDKNNASEISTNIFSFLDKSIKSIEYDATNLRYISADGLDIILETKKQCKDITIHNARMGICDILETYGFDNFININKQYRFVSIDGCKVIGKGGHGIIYQISEDTIVKVYIDHSALEVIENERQYARNAFSNGIPTAIAYDVVETKLGYGVIFELINGMTLGQYIAKHPEKLEECSIKFIDLLHTLHTTNANPDLYEDFHQIYLQRAEKAKVYIGEENGETLKKIINCIPLGHGMVHGDYHANNVMIDDAGEVMLIDMADISRGNGFFDLGGTYMIMNFIARIPLVRLFVKNITNVDYKTSIKMWDIMIARYYNTDDEQFLEKQNQLFKAFSSIRIACQIGMPSSRPKIITKLVGLFGKYIVIPRADKYIEILSTLK